MLKLGTMTHSMDKWPSLSCLQGKVCERCRECCKDNNSCGAGCIREILLYLCSIFIGQTFHTTDSRMERSSWKLRFCKFYATDLTFLLDVLCGWFLRMGYATNVQTQKYLKGFSLGWVHEVCAGFQPKGQFPGTAEQRPLMEYYQKDREGKQKLLDSRKE